MLPRDARLELAYPALRGPSRAEKARAVASSALWDSLLPLDPVLASHATRGGVLRWVVPHFHRVKSQKIAFFGAFQKLFLKAFQSLKAF